MREGGAGTWKSSQSAGRGTGQSVAAAGKGGDPLDAFSDKFLDSTKPEAPSDTPAARHLPTGGEDLDVFRITTGDDRPTEVKIFDCIYGVLHSPDYRETYKEFLKIDFRRIP